MYALISYVEEQVKKTGVYIAASKGLGWIKNDFDWQQKWVGKCLISIKSKQKKWVSNCPPFPSRFYASVIRKRSKNKRNL